MRRKNAEDFKMTIYFSAASLKMAVHLQNEIINYVSNNNIVMDQHFTLLEDLNAPQDIKEQNEHIAQQPQAGSEASPKPCAAWDLGHTCEVFENELCGKTACLLSRTASAVR